MIERITDIPVERCNWCGSLISPGAAGACGYCYGTGLIAKGPDEAASDERLICVQPVELDGGEVGILITGPPMTLEGLVEALLEAEDGDG